MRRVLLAFALVCAFAAAAGAQWFSPNQFSAAPVTSVNGAQGDVVIQTVQRQVSGALDVSAGSATWNFPAPFKNAPTCWVSIVSSAANTVFSQAVTTAISTTSVTISLQAAKTVVNLLSLGTLTVWTNPPSGTTATLSCVGALP